MKISISEVSDTDFVVVFILDENNEDEKLLAKELRRQEHTVDIEEVLKSRFALRFNNHYCDRPIDPFIRPVSKKLAETK